MSHFIAGPEAVTTNEIVKLCTDSYCPFAPATVLRDDGANRTAGSFAKCAFSYRHLFVDVIS